MKATPPPNDKVNKKFVAAKLPPPIHASAKLPTVKASKQPLDIDMSKMTGRAPSAATVRYTAVQATTKKTDKPSAATMCQSSARTTMGKSDKTNRAPSAAAVAVSAERTTTTTSTSSNESSGLP